MKVYGVLGEHEHVFAARNVIENRLIRPHGQRNNCGTTDEGHFVFACLLRNLLHCCALFGRWERERFFLTARLFLSLQFVQIFHPVFEVTVGVAVEAAKWILHVLFKFIKKRKIFRQLLQRLHV